MRQAPVLSSLTLTDRRLETGEVLVLARGLVVWTSIRRATSEAMPVRARTE
jgi:hypothetical protein